MSDAPPPSSTMSTVAPRLLAPSDIRARRRPRAVVYVWLFELASAFVIATPVHLWARSVWATHPDGDAAIWKPAGLALLAWLGDEGPALSVVVRTSLLLFVLFGVASQLVTGSLVAALAVGTGAEGRAPATRFALRAGAASFAPLVALGVIFGAVEGFFLGVGLFASSAVDHGLQDSMGDARAFSARVVVLALFVAITLLAGVVGDLARVTLVRDIALETAPVTLARRLRDAVTTSIRTARASLGRAALAWGSRAALGLALVYLGARAGDAIGGRGGGALWLLFGAHQAIVLVRAALRASWLAHALRLVGGDR